MNPDDYAGLVAGIPLSDAAAYGWVPAAVLQQVRWSIKHDRQLKRGVGWYEGSSADIGVMCAISPDQARRAMAKLIKAGAMERKRQVSSAGEGKPKFRPTNIKPAKQADGDSATPRDGDSATPRDGKFATPSSSLEENRDLTTPHSPPAGGSNEDPALFDDKPDAQASKTKARRAKANGRQTAMESTFVPWWQDAYPKEPDAKKRGGRAAGLRAWIRTLERGTNRSKQPVTIAELTLHAENYAAARRLYRNHWAEYGLDVWPPLLHASTFINGRSFDWAEPWELADCRYWPAPDGQDWDAPRPAVERLTAEELAAEIEAEEKELTSA